MAGDRKDWVKDGYMSCSLSSIASKATDLGEFEGETDWELEAEVEAEAGWVERQEEII